MGDEDLKRLNPESLQLLEEAGFEWRAAMRGFFHPASGKTITYKTVLDSAAEALAVWLAEQ